MFASPTDFDGRRHTLAASSRFENKYIVSPVLVPALRQFLEAVARPDPFSLRSANRRYPVGSLYLDSYNLRSYHQTVRGDMTRSKLRVRAYSDRPETPVFLEVKTRINLVVTKSRVCLSRREASVVINRGLRWREACPPRQAASDFERFADEMTLNDCRPLVRVRYLREAYVGEEPGVRVTFDTDLEFQPTFSADLRLAGAAWRAVPVDGVLLEVKFSGAAPGWIQELIRGFNLNQTAYCKFASAVGRMLEHPASAVSCGRGSRADGRQDACPTRVTAGSASGGSLTARGDAKKTITGGPTS